MNKILVANRGEIAIRVMRACRELGIDTVAVYSEADKEALFVKYADESVLIGPPSPNLSYLDIEKIIQVAHETGAEAIHPGYGFLAENPTFSRRCEEEGIIFIGPSPKVLEVMGNKISARKEMKKAGTPVVPGTDEATADHEQALRIAEEIGYPVIVKPADGGGGIGMSIVHSRDDLLKAIEASKAMAANAFGTADVFIEKYVLNPRHIEIQILGDAYGNAVHLNERECSIQRRYQKVIEEAPSTALTPEVRQKMGETAVNAAKWIGYQGAGTMEFIYSNGDFYFLEMNTRVQVEHPVTEMITGIDIVKEQISIASGNPLSFGQEDVRINGWAIECRINAEDPANDFAPCFGKLKNYRSPGGTGIRVDSGVYAGFAIPPFYDSMISKLLAWGRDRNEAVARMRRALYEYIISGIKTNILFHQAVLENPRFLEGKFDTHFIEEETGLFEDMKMIKEQKQMLVDKLPNKSMQKERVAALAAAAVVNQIYRQYKS
ncbi:PycA2: pyruvate carboxylase, subunit A [Desulfosarcina variabilis str. Montpellier]